MNCTDAVPLLNSYADAELDAQNSLAMEGHLALCPSCRGRFEQVNALRHTVRGAGLYRAAPADLRAQVLASLAASAEAPPTVRRAWFRPAAMALAALLVVVLGLTYAFRGHGDALARAVVDAHVRSLLAAHIVDVHSSDRHTVKPWFNGKVDYALDVPDFTAQGFPLLGGRLELLEGRRVAALVYQRRAHYINVFIFPSETASNGAGDLDGYHYIHWTHDGRTWWVISDLAPDELLQFAALMGRP